MKITLKDVATRLELSPTLVSQVLNNKGDLRVAPDTRQRILDMAAAMNYRPSASARALATGRTMQIAALAGSTGRHVGGQYPDLAGLIDVAGENDYRVVVLPLHSDDRGVLQLENLMRDRFCDGICLFCDQLSDEQSRVIQDHRLPCVVIGDQPASTVAQDLNEAVRVDFDNYLITYDAVKWLHGRGCGRIAYMYNQGEGDQSHCVALRSGFSHAVRDLYGETEPHFEPPIASDEERLRFLERSECSAIIVRHPFNAMSWGRLAIEMGRRVPEDFTVLAVVEAYGANAFCMAGWGENMACSIHDWRQCARLGGQILLDWINQGSPPPQRVYYVPPIGPGWAREVVAALGDIPVVNLTNPGPLPPRGL